MGRTPPPVEGMYTLKVDNLSFDATARDLHSLFNRYGEVGDIYIPRHRNGTQNRGFGFVRFLDKRDATEAMDDLHGTRFQGRDLRIDVAKYKRPDYNRYGGPAGGGHYSRGFGGANSFYGGSRRGRSRSRSRSRSRDRRSRSRSHRRSRSRSRSPRRRSRSPRRKSRSRSRSPRHSASRSPRQTSRSPRRSSRSSSRGRQNGRHSGSRSRSPE